MITALKNYVTLFTTPELLNMIAGTILLAIVVAVLAVLLGTMGAIGTFIVDLVKLYTSKIKMGR